MARASYSVTPRALFDDERFLGLPESASSLLLRVYGTCDRWGRFPATPIALARRVGILRCDIDADIAAIAASGLVRLYEVDGAKCGEVTGLESVLTARMVVKRGAPDFPDPPWHQGAPNGPSNDGEGTAKGHLGAPNGDLGGHLSGPPDSQEPEPKPKPYTHPAPAPEPAHVASGVPRSAMTATLARGIAAGEALAATPDPDPLPGDLEALAVALLDRVATLRHEHGKFSDVGKDLAKTRALVEVSTGPEVRAMAREYADACRELLPRALEPGDPLKLGKGLTRPNCLSYLSAAVTGWVAGEARPAGGNGKNRQRAADAPIEYAKPAEFPHWRKDFKPTREQIAQRMGMTLAEYDAAESAGAAS